MQQKPQNLDRSRYTAQGYNPRPISRAGRLPRSIDGIQAPQRQQPKQTMPERRQSVSVFNPQPMAQRQQAVQSNDTLPKNNPQITAVHQHVQGGQQDSKNRSGVAKKPNLIKKITNFRFRNKRSMLFATLALCLFLIGVGVNVKSFLVTRKIQATTVEAASDSSDSGGTTGNADESPVSNTQIAAYQVAPNMPRYLKISGLGVFSRIKRMGTNNNGVVDAPKSVFDVGWYDGSAKPGEDGAVFIDGHVSGPTKGGVFVNLSKLETGAKMQVEMGDGRTYTYKVVAKEIYDADKVDMAKALRSIEPGKKGLNLMTCNGKYDAKGQTYNKRLVIYGVLE